MSSFFHRLFSIVLENHISYEELRFVGVWSLVSRVCAGTPHP